MTASTDETAAVRVAEGAALLDESCPGWAGLVDVDERTRTGALDVLEQLWRTPENARRMGAWHPSMDARIELDSALGADSVRNPQRYGFVADPVAGIGDVDLDAAWIAEIRRRMGVAA